MACEHQRLREEGAADGGLLADGADAEGGETLGAGELAVLEEEDGGGFGVVTRRLRDLRAVRLLEDDGAEVGDGADEFVGERAAARTFSHCVWSAAARFEVHGLDGGFAVGGDLDEHAIRRGCRRRRTRLRLRRVLLGRAGLRVPWLQGARHFFISP